MSDNPYANPPAPGAPPPQPAAPYAPPPQPAAPYAPPPQPVAQYAPPPQYAPPAAQPAPAPAPTPVAQPAPPAAQPAAQPAPPPPGAPASPVGMLGSMVSEAVTDASAAAASLPAPIEAAMLKLPDGVSADTPEVSGVLAAMNQGLSPVDTANALITHLQNSRNTLVRSSQQAWHDEQLRLQNVIATDPEIGGAHLPQVKADIARLITTYGDQEFINDMNNTGAGNRMSVVKFLNRLAKQLAEPGAPAGAAATRVDSEQAALERRYPTMAKS